MMAFLAEQAVVLLVLVPLVALLLPRRGLEDAARRHAAWCLVLVLALAMPLLRTMTPDLWDWRSSAIALQTEVNPVALPSLPLVSDAPRSERPEAAVSDAVALVPLGPGPRDSGFEWSWMHLWVLGASLTVLRLGAAHWRVWRLEVKAALVTDPEWTRVVDAGRRQLGIRRPVRLLFSEDVRTAATWGLRRPSIVLPPAADAWNRSQRAAILAHELNHVRRRDHLTLQLVDLATVWLWFHPMAWWVRRQLALERELACDGGVVRLGMSRQSYAIELVGLVRQAVGQTHAVPGFGQGLLEPRVRALLRPAPGTTRAVSLRGGLFFASIVGLASWGEASIDANPVEVVARVDEVEELVVEETLVRAPAAVERTVQPTATPLPLQEADPSTAEAAAESATEIVETEIEPASPLRLTRPEQPIPVPEAPRRAVASKPVKDASPKLLPESRPHFGLRVELISLADAPASAAERAAAARAILRNAMQPAKTSARMGVWNAGETLSPYIERKDYLAASYSFSHATRDDRRRTHNDWELLLRGKNEPLRFDVSMVTDDQSYIVDLGRVSAETARRAALARRSGTEEAIVKLNHIYLVRTLDTWTDHRVLVEVTGITPAGQVDFHWRWLDEEPIR